MPDGRFIVLEGIDGSGTTLQTGALGSRLRERGHDVLETHEPSTGAIGRLIRERLATGAAHADPWSLALLFAADRIDHVEHEIGPAVAAGRIVLCDRYVMSSWAYQSLDCDPEWVHEINRRAPWPDLTLFLDVPAEVAFARIERRKASGGPAQERFEVPDTQGRLARAYGQLARREDLANVRRVDGTRAPEAVTEDLLAACVEIGL